jgi:predicted nucleic-acid-binding Zn-ribbon protein
MNRFSIILLVVFLLGIDSCKKEENSAPDQFPEWLQSKITELTSEFDLCKYTDVTIIEFQGKKYYHVYCGVWSCMYCQLFDEDGVRPNWDTNGWNDFFANKKEIKVVPACQ